MRLRPCRQVRRDLLSKLIPFPTAVLVTFIAGTDSRARKTPSRGQVASRTDVKKPETSAPSKCVDASWGSPFCGANLLRLIIWIFPELITGATR